FCVDPFGLGEDALPRLGSSRRRVGRARLDASTSESERRECTAQAVTREEKGPMTREKEASKALARESGGGHLEVRIAIEPHAVERHGESRVHEAHQR